jgi:hypothetical protein
LCNETELEFHGVKICVQNDFNDLKISFLQILVDNLKTRLSANDFILGISFLSSKHFPTNLDPMSTKDDVKVNLLFKFYATPESSDHFIDGVALRREWRVN